MNILITKHARQRMSQRSISHEEIEKTIQYGSKTMQEDGTYRVTYDKFVVITVHKNGMVYVVTCFYAKEYNKIVRRYARKQTIGIYAAIRILRSLEQQNKAG